MKNFRIKTNTIICSIVSICFAFLILLQIGSTAKAETGSSLVISPPSGDYVSTQEFDVVVIAAIPTGVTITNGTVTLNDTDVTFRFMRCMIFGTLDSGGDTFRCPRLTEDIFGTGGKHTLYVSLELSDETNISDTVNWEIYANTEP